MIRTSRWSFGIFVRESPPFSVLLDRLACWWKLQCNGFPSFLRHVHESEFFKEANSEGGRPTEDEAAVFHCGIGPTKSSARVNEFAVGDCALAEISIINGDSCFSEVDAFEASHGSPYTSATWWDVKPPLTVRQSAKRDPSTPLPWQV